jgi:hypothetical protein
MWDLLGGSTWTLGGNPESLDSDEGNGTRVRPSVATRPLRIRPAAAHLYAISAMDFPRGLLALSRLPPAMPAGLTPSRGRT